MTGVNEYEVIGDLQTIDFGATGEKEILQNVRMILTTPEYSCPMERDFAWNPDVDAPINIAQARTTAKIVDAIQKYESRAQVVRVSYQGDGVNGTLLPVVKVRLSEEV